MPPPHWYEESIAWLECNVENCQSSEQRKAFEIGAFHIYFTKKAFEVVHAMKGMGGD
jgi:hypothetical protein